MDAPKVESTIKLVWYLGMRVMEVYASNMWIRTHFYFMGSFCAKSLLNITQKLADEILSFRRKLCLFREFQVTSPVHNLHEQRET